ncbi:MAG: hypothetical protein EBU80_10355 [Chitinophagia bacterium]|jgi:hypothetical protein|nr:hypothetical protein [Chitinophagia bacterium]
MKKAIGLFLLTINILLMSCANAYQIKKGDMLFKITFAQGFSNDTLSLCLNSCRIVYNRILSSDNTSDGITDLQISVFKKNVSFSAKIFQGKEISCQADIRETIKIEIVLNGSSQSFTIDTKQGAYLSIEKNGNDLSLRQTKEQVLYD